MPTKASAAVRATHRATRAPAWRAILIAGAVAALPAGCVRPDPCLCNAGSRFVDAEIQALTAADRETDLRRVRELLLTSYPHLDEKRQRFGVDVEALIARARPALGRAVNRYQYQNAIDRILLAFRDGHLTTRGYLRAFRSTYRARPRTPPRGKPRPRPRVRPPPVVIGLGLRLRYVDSQVVVVDVRPGSPAARAGVRRGDVVLMTNHDAALARVGSALRWRGWARLPAGLQRAASRVLIDRPWYPDTPRPTARLVLRRGTRRIFVHLTGERVPPRLERFFGAHTARCGIRVVRLGTFRGARRPLWQRIRALLEGARAARGLVLDLRGNRGGELGLALRTAAALIDKPLVAGHHRYLRSKPLAAAIPIIDKLAADGTDPRWTVWVADRLTPAANPLRLPTAALIDEVCASACEGLARALRAAPGIRLYGRATAGSSGLPVHVTLPRSRLRVRLPSWQSRTADGQPIEGYGVRPHVRVPLRLDALQRGRDAALERALSDLCAAAPRGP